MENLQIKPNSCSQLTFNKGNKNIKWGKEQTHYSTNGTGITGQPYVEE